MKAKEIVVGLVGNPNSGKTTIFNALTGARQKVANWSGVTVEKREGRLTHRGRPIRVIDLPGIYSLTSYSIEEIITRDFILNDRPDVLVNVADAGNLERNLYLTTQLITIGARAVMALNMFDEAEARGLAIDADKLGTLLGMPVVPTVGNRSRGIEELKDEILKVAQKSDARSRHIHIPFVADVENEIKKIQSAIRREPDIGKKYSTRWLAIRLLERDADVDRKLRAYPNHADIADQVRAGRAALEKKYNDDIETIISDGRYGFTAGAVRESVKEVRRNRADVSEQIDRVITHRYLGFPVLFASLLALFYLTFALGEHPMALIELGVKHTASLVDSVMAPGPLKDMVIDGVIGGVGSVIVFLPNILILFAGVSFMEDTGYMARAAFIMDRIMHALGIHGKSFISLVMGFGCNVPAIMVTRSLENHQDRLLTILINPFMSCSARLPVYILFAGIFFREHAGAVILSLYMAGILLAFLSARLFKLLLFRGATTPFVMELPPYRMPTVKMTLLHMWDRSSQYIRKMGGIILACSILIWAAGEYPKSPAVQREYAARLARLEAAHAGKAGGEYEGLKERLLIEKAAREKERTVIGRAGSALHPLLEPLGLNWQMGVSLVAGFVAKEIVVSTMGVLYHAPPGHEGPHRGRHSLMETLQKPEHGITPLAAYTFMLFVLLYVPCLATIVVIGREAGWGWALFSIAYQLVFAWLVCFLFYNTVRLIGL